MTSAPYGQLANWPLQQALGPQHWAGGDIDRNYEHRAGWGQGAGGTRRQETEISARANLYCHQHVHVVHDAFLMHAGQLGPYVVHVDMSRNGREAGFRASRLTAGLRQLRARSSQDRSLNTGVVSVCSSFTPVFPLYVLAIRRSTSR